MKINARDFLIDYETGFIIDNEIFIVYHKICREPKKKEMLFLCHDVVDLCLQGLVVNDSKKY